MALARIITRSQACSRQLAMDLLARGYAVEIVSPDQIPDNLADLELRVEEDPGNQLVATVETHSGGRSASLDFTHHLRAPMGEFIRKIPEPGDVARLTGQIVNFADAERIKESVAAEAAGSEFDSQPILRLTAKAISSVPRVVVAPVLDVPPLIVPAVVAPARVEPLPVEVNKAAPVVPALRLEEQPSVEVMKPTPRSPATVAPATVIRVKLPKLGISFAGFPQKFAAFTHGLGEKLPRRLVVRRFDLPKAALPKIGVPDIGPRFAAATEKLKGLVRISELKTPTSRGIWSAGLGFAGIVALALFLAFGLRHNELRPADNADLANTLPAISGAANSPNSSDTRSQDSSIATTAEVAVPAPVPNKPAISSIVPSVSRPSKPTRIKVQPKNQDDFVAPNTVTYLDHRFAPQTVAKSSQNHKSTKTVARRHSRSRQRRDDVIAANKVTYLDKPAKSQKATK